MSGVTGRDFPVAPTRRTSCGGRLFDGRVGGGGFPTRLMAVLSGGEE
jgi:hypothetical protein